MLLSALALFASAAGCHDPLGPSGPPIYGVIVGIGAPVPKYVFPGMTLNMWAQANDSNHVVMPVDSWEWSSSNRSVADVDQEGHVTVKAQGITAITATARGRSGTFALPVVNPQSLYAVDPNPSNLLPGQQRSFRILEGPISGPQTIIAKGRWTSSDLSVARVDSNGVVTAVGPGRATLTVVRNVGVDITLNAELTVPSVPSPLRFLQVVAGDSFSCGRTSSDIYCWGKTAIGTSAQLDACSTYTYFALPGPPYQEIHRDAFQCAMEPMRVEAPVPFVSISAQGGIACGVTADGHAYCWGGTGALPTLMSDSLHFANFIGRCGVTTTHEGWCWDAFALSKVAGGALWQRIDVAGADYRCGVEIDGTYACWGANAKGQLGTGDSVAYSLPVPIKSTERFTAGIGGGSQRACALSVAGVIYCWGDWRLGSSPLNSGTPTPTPMTAEEPLTSLTGDPSYGFCGLSSGGLSYCGAVGLNSTKMTASQPGMRFTSDAANATHRCALAADALLYCWGLNDSGELGVGTQDYISNPKRVAGQ